MEQVEIDRLKVMEEKICNVTVVGNMDIGDPNVQKQVDSTGIGEAHKHQEEHSTINGMEDHHHLETEGCPRK